MWSPCAAACAASLVMPRRAYTSVPWGKSPASVLRPPGSCRGWVLTSVSRVSLSPAGLYLLAGGGCLACPGYVSWLPPVPPAGGPVWIEHGEGVGCMTSITYQGGGRMRLNSKGQVTIPAHLRELYGLQRATRWTSSKTAAPCASSGPRRPR